jgi:hypothetical protein
LGLHLGIGRLGQQPLSEDQKEKEEKYVFYFHFLKAIAKIIIIFESSFK